MAFDKKKIFYLKKLTSLILLISIWVSAIAFAQYSYQESKCTGIIVKLDSENEKPLLSKKHINQVITEEGTRYFEDKPLEVISLHRMEQSVKKIPLVKSCEAHFDFSGKIIVSVKEFSPIARILRSTSELSTQPDQYVTAEGNFIGTSSLFTPRVLVVTGDYFKSNRKDLKDDKGKTLLPLFEYINENEFWKAQISQVVVANDGGIILVPTFGTTNIDFGLPINIENKFKKLAIFYKQIIPNRGWNTYSWVRLKYKNQLICD
ncbi:cell division protein FtsQ/DivIB [Aquirufa sp. ROCK-SH2]